MKMLALSMIIVALIGNTMVTAYKLYKLQYRIERIESNYQHLLHRMNAIEYPEVLGKEMKGGMNEERYP